MFDISYNFGFNDSPSSLSSSTSWKIVGVGCISTLLAHFSLVPVITTNLYAGVCQLDETDMHVVQ